MILSKKKINLCFLLWIASQICLTDGCKCDLSKSGSATHQSALNPSYKLLTISCLDGKKKSFIAHFNRPIKPSDSRSGGYLVAIGLPNKALWNTKKWQDYLFKKVTHCIHHPRQKLFEKDGIFIALHRLDGLKHQSFNVPLKEDEYQQLLNNGYHIYTIVVNPTIPNRQLDKIDPIQLPGKAQKMVNYSGIALQAQHAIKEEISGQVNWRLQGRINRDYAIKDKSNTQVGFLLAEKKAGFSTWNLVQKKILNGLDGSGHLLDGAIMVPGRLTTTNDLLISNESSKHLPTKDNVKLLAYLVQGNHYYISQMQYFLSNGMDDATQASTPPPTITNYSLKLPSLEIILHKTERPSTIRDVSLKGLTIDFLMNGLPKKWPTDVKGYLLIQKKEKTQPTNLSDLDCNRVAALFKEMKPGQNSAMTKDGKLCLITNHTQKIDPLCLPFFDTDHLYRFFICGFSERDKTFQYYKDLESKLVKITEKKVPFEDPWSNYTRPAQRSPASIPVINETNATRAISADILCSPSRTKKSCNENLENSNQVQQDFYSREDCNLADTLFFQNIENLQGLIYTDQDKDPNKLAEYVSNYLKKLTGKKCNENNILVFKKEEASSAKAALVIRSHRYYHWATTPDKTEPTNIELCEGHIRK